MKITIDSNIFIDLLKADETAIRLLNILCDNKEDFHWILHKRQLDEIILVAGRVVDEFPEGEERDNAADFLHYMERLRSVLLQSPEKGNTYRTTFGDPTAPTEPGRNAKLAIDIAANLRREDPDWITEITDSIIVTHTMLEHGSLFSRDKAHIEPMVAKIRQIQSELEILPPAWKAEIRKHKGFLELHNPDKKRRLPPPAIRRNAKTIAEALGPSINTP